MSHSGLLIGFLELAMVCLCDIEGEQAVMCQLQSERQVRGGQEEG